MAEVDPYVINIPEFFLNHKDPAVRAWFNYDNRWKHDMWVRSGGGNDAVAEAQIGELYEPGIQTSNVDELADDLEVSAEMQFIHDLLERVEDLEAVVGQPLIDDRFEIITIATGDTAFTTTGNQVIICNNTAALTLTLNTLPDDGEKLTIIRRDGPVSIVGTLNGSTPTAIPSKFDVLDVYYTLAAGEWSA